MIDIFNLELLSNEKRDLMSCLISSDLNQKTFGQLYGIKLKKDAIVGNHYHKFKDEWIVLINGKIKIYLEDINTGTKKQIIMDSSNPSKIRIPPYFSHAVENISEGESILIEYATLPFNKHTEDKFPHKVSPS